MKVTIEITTQEIKNLKLIRNYFGEHDITQLQYMAYSELYKLINKLEQSNDFKNTCSLFICTNTGNNKFNITKMDTTNNQQQPTK